VRVGSTNGRATTLAEFTAAVSTAASSIICLRRDSGAMGFVLIVSLSVRGGPVAVARVKAALRAVGERQQITVSLQPLSDSAVA
jgi:hypothetical protein